MAREAAAVTRIALGRNNPLIRESDWLLVMDLDEFVAIKTGDYRVDDLIKHPIVSATGTGMYLCLALFGNADQDPLISGPVTERLAGQPPLSFTRDTGQDPVRADPHLTLAIPQALSKAVSRTEEAKTIQG